jgi:hypothetical protein
MPSSAAISRAALPLFNQRATASLLKRASNFLRGCIFAAFAAVSLTTFITQAFYFSPLAGVRQIEATSLDGKIITADPLHCQRGHGRGIVEKGGNYLLQIKGNQPNLLKQAQGLDALPNTPFLPKPIQDTDGSRPGACTPLPSNPSQSIFPSPDH